MGYKVNFSDNSAVSADDLNNILEETGIESTDFSDNTPYGVDDLNNISRTLVTKGVVSGCSVSCDDESVNISSGEAYFDDGSKIIIDNDGISIKRPNGEFYVWLKKDMATGYAGAGTGEEVPQGAVRLAKVSDSGTVSLMQDLALMKKASLLPNHYITKTVTISVQSGGEKDGTIDIGGNYRRMILRAPNGSMAYYNWDSGKVYEVVSNITKEYDIDFGKLVRLNNAAHIAFVSFENNIISYKTSGYGTYYATFYLDCM